jgi:prepilin-type processing-associated H-X9-DG protein
MNLSILTCPTDLKRGTPRTDSGASTEEDRAARSYLINGWNDFFYNSLGQDAFYSKYMRGTYPVSSMRDLAVLRPSETIIFGEKRNKPAWDPNEQISMDYYMDMLEGQGGNDADKLEHGCHSGNRQGRSGGSNFAMVDGSVRYMKYGSSVNPINMWAVADIDRLTYAFNPP